MAPPGSFILTAPNKMVDHGGTEDLTRAAPATQNNREVAKSAKETRRRKIQSDSSRLSSRPLRLRGLILVRKTRCNTFAMQRRTGSLQSAFVLCVSAVNHPFRDRFEFPAP